MTDEVARIAAVLHEVDIIDQYEFATDDWWYKPDAAERLYAAGLRVAPDLASQDALENDLRALWAATPAELAKRLTARGWGRLREGFDE